MVVVYDIQHAVMWSVCADERAVITLANQPTNALYKFTITYLLLLRTGNSHG